MSGWEQSGNVDRSLKKYEHEFLQEASMIGPFLARRGRKNLLQALTDKNVGPMEGSFFELGESPRYYTRWTFDTCTATCTISR